MEASQRYVYLVWSYFERCNYVKDLKIGIGSDLNVLVKSIQFISKTSRVRVVTSYGHPETEDNRARVWISPSVWHGRFHIVQALRCDLPGEWRHLHQYCDTVFVLPPLWSLFGNISEIIWRHQSETHSIKHSWTLKALSSKSPEPVKYK